MPYRTDPIRSAQHRELLAEAARASLALSGRSAEIEAQRHLPQDIADSLANAGLYRLLTPQAHGGHEAHPATFYAVIEQLGPIAKVDTSARLEGRNMTMVLAPEKKAPVKKERTPGEAKSGSDEAADAGSDDGDLPIEAETHDSQPEQTQAPEPEPEPEVEEQAVEAAGDAV